MDKKITVGIASFGMSGKVFHAPLLAHHAQYRLKRIVEHSRNEAAPLYPAVHVTRSFEDLLADDEVELIVVNTPDPTHFVYAQKALEAGKHVVVEKPFCQSVRQGEELIALAKTKGVVLTVFQNRRWDSDFLTVRKILAEELLGRLVDYEAHFDRYKNSVALESWKEQASAGTGVLFNLGSHMIDQALVLFGMPEAVTGELRVVRPGGEVADWYDLRMHYPHVRVNLKSSMLVREPGPRYLLHGTEGSFLKWGLDTQEDALKAGKIPGEPGWGSEPEKLWGILHTNNGGAPVKKSYESVPGNYAAFYDDVASAIRRGTPLAVPAEQALDVIRIIEAVRSSSAERRTIPFR